MTEYTDCVGICGYCELKSTCDNPKRLNQKKKIERSKHVHYWVETESDSNGKPTKYKCIYCLRVFNIPNEQDLTRNYLKLKYGINE